MFPCNKSLSRRSRGKSCPAGVLFRNDIRNFETRTIQKSKSTNLLQTLEKESNFIRERRQSFPKALCDKLGLQIRDESLTKKAPSSLHLQNYSLTGGIAHNLFCRKLADAHKLSDSAVDVCNQHTTLNNLSPAHRCLDVQSSFAEESTPDIAADFKQISAHENDCFSTYEKRVKFERNTPCIKQSLGEDNKYRNISFSLQASEQTGETLSKTDFTEELLENSSSCSEVNQKPGTTSEICPSFKELDGQTLTNDLHLLCDSVIAAEDQDKTLSTLDGSKQDLDNSFLQSSAKELIENHSRNSSHNDQNFEDQTWSELLTFVRDRVKTGHGQNVLPNPNKTSLDSNESFIRRFLQELNSLEVVDSEDDLKCFLGRVPDLTTDSDVTRLESHIEGTELLVENLAGQVEEAKEEIKMTAQKQENEINDLILLNEEMQTIWSAKETEVREMLERFSAYRSAVEADSKEKDDLFSEEIHKRETLINDLQLTKDALQDELQRQTDVFRQVLSDLQNFEATQVQQLGHINQLVAGLLEAFPDQEASLVCQSISVKLETSIATIKEKDYARYISCLNIGIEAESSEELKGNYSKKKLAESFSSSMDEGKGYSILSSSDGERNELVGPEQFSSDDFRCCTPVAVVNDEFYETLDEDFARLLNEITETGNEDFLEGYIAKKTVIALLEGQASKYQFLCKEKDAEIQHWQRKHKQDTHDLQGILEEQERVEAKTNESLVQLQSDIEKLQQRNKFLESEVEFAKEQGEDDVSFLKESFQKDLSAQLRRQSQSFLFAEENVRNELVELESQNEELKKNNQDLKREIEEHCGEIKSWVSEILTLSEGEYNEEFNSITDVLAKLHKIIYENKRTVDSLQEELKEYKRTVYECSPPDTLSQSWGGHSLSSMELQKELCRNCKQTKWQRLLMGSLDIVDSSLENKQDEVERLVNKLSVDDNSKNRKKHSLKDSLELADGQLEHLQRLSRQEFGSLETLGEDSLEESDGGNFGDNDVVDGMNGCKPEDDISQSNVECGDELPSGNAECGDAISNSGSKENSDSTTVKHSASSVDRETAEYSEETWENIHVNPRLLTQYSISPDLEFINFQKEVESDGLEREESHQMVCEEGGTNEHWLMERDNNEQLSIDEDNDGYEEDEDTVKVVNLYRSLIVHSDMPQHGIIVDEKKSEEFGEQDGEYRNQTGDEVDGCYDQLVRTEAAYDDNHPTVSDVLHFPIPKIVVEEDVNGNFLEQESNEENYNEISDRAPNTEFHGESCVQNDQFSSNVGEYGDESVEARSNYSIPNGCDFKEINRMVLGDEIKVNRVKPQRKISESWSISVDSKNSIVEFVGELGNEIAAPTTCMHCSESFECFKTQLMDVIANQRKNQEKMISKELEETKLELRELQSDYQKLENLCADYRNYVDEYSGNLKRKNEELRKVKLSSNIMETEIGWLRQALGITRNYAEF